MAEILEIEKVTRSQAERWKPKYEHTPVEFKNKNEAYAYAERERDRWKNGYNGLDGWHYKMLSQCFIPNAGGAMIRPYWRDGDESVVFHPIADCRKNKRDKFTLKRREYGLSSVDGGFTPINIAMENPGCSIRLTSADENRTNILMNEKVMKIASWFYKEAEDAWKKVAGENAGNLLRPEMRYTKSDMTLRIDFGEDVISVIEGIQTSKGVDSAKKMEGPRLSYAMIDEFFLHKFAKTVRDSADGSRNEGGARWGWMSIGGSAGQGTIESAKTAQDLWYNHDIYRMNIVFVPATYCIARAYKFNSDGTMSDDEIPGGFMLNGYSLVEEAEEWIHKSRKLLYSLSDKTSYWNYVKQYPLTPDEVFETTGVSSWTMEEKARFEAQKKYIFVNNKKAVGVNLIPNGQGGVKPVENGNSPIQIIRWPNPNYKYVVGIDPTPIITRKEADDRSEYGVAVKCLDTNTYDAKYKERSKDSSRLVERTIQLQRFYPGHGVLPFAQAMIERNRADAIIKEYDIRGCLDMLAKEPLQLRPASAKIIEIGYAKTVHNADDLADNLMRWARWFDEKKGYGGIESIWDLEMLDEVFTFDIGNKDLADAMISAELFHWSIEDLAMRQQRWNNRQGEPTKRVRINTMINGKPGYTYVELPAAHQKFPQGYKVIGKNHMM